MSGRENTVYEFGDFRVDAGKRSLFTASGDRVQLMPKAFETILYLVENPGRVIEKDELLTAVWPDIAVEENNLTQNISVLRRVFGEKPGEHRYIVTVPGRGYKFVADVRTADTAQEQAAEQPAAVDEPAMEQRPAAPAAAPGGRFWLFTIGSICLLALLTIGFYMWREKNTAAAPVIRSLAVLPFKPLVTADRNEALELGMADNLISRLNSSGDISVRQLNQVLRYNSLDQDPLSAGIDLGADAVLDGNIQTSGDRIRVSARLLSTGDGRQLWTGQFDESFTDIFAVQDSISQKVAEALKARLGLRKQYTESLEAYQHYATARYHQFKLTKPDIDMALSSFQRAIAADPNYALAYVGLAETYYPMALTLELPSSEPMLKARSAAAKAIELDPELADGYAAMGLVNFWYDWDWASSERNFRRAVDLAPGQAHWGYAHLLSNTGRHAEALTEIKRGRAVDPANVLVGAVEGQALYYAGKNNEAIDRLNQTIAMSPGLWLPHLFISRAYSDSGMHAEAVAAAEKAFQLSGSSQANAYRAFVMVKAGRPDEARNILAEMRAAAESRYVPPYTFAEVQMALGEGEQALNELEKGFAEKDVRMVFLKVDPMWGPLRNEPRFIEIMRGMNF